MIKKGKFEELATNEINVEATINMGPRQLADIKNLYNLVSKDTQIGIKLVKQNNDFDMISINMAKNQLLALNINKLSGHCGKLMCCLKYENEAYKDLRRGLPKLNAQVEYEGEVYRVTSMNVIQKTCKLENKTNSLFITLDELEEKGKYRASVNKIKKETSDETSEEL